MQITSGNLQKMNHHDLIGFHENLKNYNFIKLCSSAQIWQIIYIRSKHQFRPNFQAIDGNISGKYLLQISDEFYKLQKSGRKIEMVTKNRNFGAQSKFVC